MEEYKNIISLDNTTSDKAQIGGGKFVGLAQIRPLLTKYKEQYGIDLELPKTFVIKSWVCLPGRKPGITPLFLRRLFAISSGLYCIVT